MSFNVCPNVKTSSTVLSESTKNIKKDLGILKKKQKKERTGYKLLSKEAKSFLSFPGRVYRLPRVLETESARVTGQGYKAI